MEKSEQEAVDRVAQIIDERLRCLQMESMLTHIEANRAIVESSRVNIESHKRREKQDDYRCANDRNFIALNALNGLLAARIFCASGEEKHLAERAYSIADAMLAEAQKL